MVRANFAGTYETEELCFFFLDMITNWVILAVFFFLFFCSNGLILMDFKIIAEKTNMTDLRLFVSLDFFNVYIP